MLLGNWTGGLKSGLPMIGPPKIFNLVQSSTSRTVCMLLSGLNMQCERLCYAVFVFWNMNSARCCCISCDSCACGDVAEVLTYLSSAGSNIIMTLL